MIQPSNNYSGHHPRHAPTTSSSSSSSLSSSSSSSSSSTNTPSTDMPTSSPYIASTSVATSPPSTSSSIDWLAPRISFTKDFTKPGGHSISHETMREIFEITESPARLSSSKSSPSEFEFSMSIEGQDSSYEQTMLAADELFHDGKLLPLYYGMPATDPIVGRRLSSVEDYTMHAHARELGRVKIDHHPISPKAPTCTSRWRELLGLKKVQIQDPGNVSKLQKKASYPSNSTAPGRRSVDSLKDPKVGLHRSEMLIQHCSRELKPSLQEAHSQHSFKATRSISHGEAHTQYGMHTNCAQIHNVHTHKSPLVGQSEFPLFSTIDPELCPTSNLHTWKIDRGTSGSRSSKSSESSEGVMTEVQQLRCNSGGMVKQRSRANSPSKLTDQTRPTSSAMSPRRGGKGMRPSMGSRPTESSRSAMTTRLVVKGLDRSYSNPKPTKKKPEQLRSSRQRALTEGSGSLERSISYSAGVRVTPVINVPIYISPGLRKGSKTSIFGLFSSKKATLSSSALHHHPHQGS